MNKPNTRAFRVHCTMIDGEGITWASSAGRARYCAYLSAKDVGWPLRLTDFRVRRAPEFDDLRPKADLRSAGVWSPQAVKAEAAML